ncbi:flavin-containing amine oxidoreductase-domain containing protein [Colletotrichum phormii]|uniref:Flavin-containing amine oxidoreductase-domain containing protein n=1 Tax=Colletotrichum phormii TaxID=359342 RepID=A0AAJ0EG71_9PEZI|nr:flavin-containing amine oxidoreductase-domain containing protein [Colletotrichum phormii]KAK1637808.1 flavin-containing amine oxidoreductase-domain containing protein [Colletotrichum phormii]
MLPSFSFKTEEASVASANKRTPFSPIGSTSGSRLAQRQSSGAAEQKARPQAWVDTPQLIYSEWNKAAGDINQPLGTLPSNFSIGLVGAGITNVVLAFNLAKAGADVTLIEATDSVGGRLRSLPTADGVNVAEMGAMRFPPSEDLLYYYANEFNYTFIQNFPDPGKVPTMVYYQEKATSWTDSNTAPTGFEKVNNGWVQLISKGLTGGSSTLAAGSQITTWLSSNDTATRNLAVPEWQKYLDTFGDDSFYTGLLRIFGDCCDGHEWDVPSGEVWTDDDFQRFGTLGIGSGGFGAVYSAGFNSVFRLVVNGLESDQAVFAKVTDSGLQPAGIRDLAQTIWEKATELGVKTKFSTVAEVTSGGGDALGGLAVGVRETSGGASTNIDYELVVVATSNWAMNYAFTPVSETTEDPIMPLEVQRAINDLHMTASSKLFIRTKKFWETQGAGFPRVILSDTNLPQTYTLKYGHPDYGMVLVTYAWEDLSLQMTAISDPKELLTELKMQIDRIMQDSDFPEYASLLEPVTDDDIYLIHWPLDRYSYGAFSLGFPGQDVSIESLFCDWERINQTQNSRVLINSDCTSFLGGWVDGGLQPAHNTLSAALEKFGTLNSAASHLAPSALLGSGLYQY